jgi:hypothetical protein
MVAEARADCLDRAGVLALGSGQRDAARHEDARQAVHGGQSHHYGR